MRRSENETLKIRPHHGLCAEFFRGEGYGDDFIQNMSAVLSVLNETDPSVILTEDNDVICRKCPHNKDGRCETAEKVSRYDGAALDICGLKPGSSLPWSEFRSLVRQKIIVENRLAEICPDCLWHGICSEQK